MKKVLATVMTAAMVLPLAACGGSDSAPAAASGAAEKAEAAVEEAAAETEEAAEEVKEEAAEEAAEEGGGKTIYVLAPNPDHGWTGAVDVYAQQKVDEVNAEGKYTAILRTVSIMCTSRTSS